MNYRQINCDVMVDTQRLYEHNPELVQMVKDSIANQLMVKEDDNIDQPQCSDSNTHYSVTENRTFEEARLWRLKGKKVAVLNFANNHSIGGAPYSAGAQEESLCRCSTLLPCIQAMRDPFYQRHIDLFANKEIDYMGNDDLIYTPDVCVFKTDERTDPIIPQLMPREEWYTVDVITSAAPDLRFGPRTEDYVERINSRIKKILDVARQQGVETLVLGAWGCGAFRNPVEVVAHAFREQLRLYDFETVVFAMGGDSIKAVPFKQEFVEEA